MEKVMVVSLDTLIKNGFTNHTGLFPCTPELLNCIYSQYEFIDRGKAETNTAYKQIIPYTVICFENNILCLTRTKKQTEKRLHLQKSIGIGGHINPVDAGDIIMAGLYRELNEEIDGCFPDAPLFLGLINDTANEVSRVHLGFAYMLKAAGSNIHIREQDKMTGSWATRQELQDCYNQLETWSQIVLDYMNK